jgi:hypothetical protein
VLSKEVPHPFVDGVKFYRILMILTKFLGGILSLGTKLDTFITPS